MNMTKVEIHEMTKHYLVCALWSSTDEDGEPLDATYTVADMPEETIQKADRDCRRFIAENEQDIDGRYEQAGHDFWLTRNGHGSGFWDGDWAEDAGERMTESAKDFRECYLYVGDDNKLYFSQCI
jgi:hypothetical protein